VNRFYQVPFGLDYIPVLPLYVTLDSMALAVLVQEWRSTGKIGKYSMIGAGWIFVQSLVHVPVVHSDWFLNAVRFVASLIRYRTKVDDPKDASVMLGCLTVGLASGVELYGLAAFATLFILGMLWIVESLEPERFKTFDLKVSAEDPTALRRDLEQLRLRRGQLGPGSRELGLGPGDVGAGEQARLEPRPGLPELVGEDGDALLADGHDLLVAQLQPQAVHFHLQRLARGEVFLQPAPGRRGRVHRELQWIDRRLQAVTGGVEPAALAVVEHEHDRDQGIAEKAEAEGRAASAK
jgi:hypothetical protein